MDAQNDATTDAVKEVSAAIRSRAMPVKTVIYPPFTPNGNPHNIAPGHLIFSSQGVSIWQDDMLSFVRSLTLNHRPSGASTLSRGRTHPACPEPGSQRQQQRRGTAERGLAQWAPSAIVEFLKAHQHSCVVPSRSADQGRV
jgi:hypothetical protein